MSVVGTFTVEVEVGRADGREFQRMDALVDTEASHTTLPASILRSLGVAPHAQGSFRLATGETVTRDIGRTWVRLNGQMEMTIVVFGDDGALPLLGAVTLEELRLAVDPVTRSLSPVPGLLA